MFSKNRQYPFNTFTLFVFFSAISLVAQQASASSQGMDENTQEAGNDTRSFHFHPALKLTAYHNDNIYAEETSTESDNIIIINPTLNIHSVWDKHSLVIDAGADIGRYQDNASENYEDLWVDANAKYEVSRSTILFGGMGFDNKHESRSSKESTQSLDSLTTYNVTTAQLGARHAMDKYTVRFGATFEHMNFDNVDGLYNDDRDRALTGLGLRLTRPINKQTKVFFQGLLNQRNYDEALDLNAYNHDSEGFTADLGFIHTVGRKNRFEAFAGVLSQDYDDPRFESISIANYGATLRWRPAKNYNFTAKITRSLNETTALGASGYIHTKSSMQLSRTFSNNYVGFIGYKSANSDYQEISRNDTADSYNIGVNYQMSPTILLSAGYSYINYDSSDSQYDYDRNLALISFKSTFSN